MASFDVVGKVRFSNGAAELRIQPASSPASSQAYKVDKEKPRVTLDEVLEQHERGAIKIHDSRLPLDQRALRSMMYNTQKTLNIEPLGHMGRWTEECHEKLLRDLQAPKGHVRGRKRRDRPNTQDPLPIQDAPVQQEQQLAEDHQGTSEKDEGMSEDHHGISEKDEGVFEDQQGVSKKDEGVSENNHGISEKYEDVSEDQQGVSKKDEGVSEDHHGISEKDEDVSEDQQVISEKDAGLSSQEPPHQDQDMPENNQGHSEDSGDDSSSSSSSSSDSSTPTRAHNESVSAQLELKELELQEAHARIEILEGDIQQYECELEELRAHLAEERASKRARK